MNILAVTAASILFLLCACSHEPVHESYTEPQHSGVDRSPHRTAEAGPSNHPSSTQFHTNLLSQINHYRARSGLKPLSIDKRLTTIAKGHCSDMNRSQMLSHRNFQQRFEQSGHTTCVENIANGYHNPKELFEAWRNSDGHDKNMLEKDIRLAGISMDGPYVTFFACDNRARSHSAKERVTYDDHSKS
jgi:uncharacterized protein YkwD